MEFPPPQKKKHFGAIFPQFPPLPDPLKTHILLILSFSASLTSRGFTGPHVTPLRQSHSIQLSPVLHVQLCSTKHKTRSQSIELPIFYPLRDAIFLCRGLFLEKAVFPSRMGKISSRRVAVTSEVSERYFTTRGRFGDVLLTDSFEIT